MRRPLTCVLVWIAAILCGQDGSAQNVTGYDSLPNPYLFLLREPAVIADLQLSPTQRRDLQQLNDEVDRPFLAMRNKNADQAQQTWEQLLYKSQEIAGEILDASQRRRLSQIMLRVRGVKLVLTPKIVEHLELSEDQKDGIEDAVDEAAKTFARLQTQPQGGASRPEVEAQLKKARDREQKQIFTQLTSKQQLLLSALLGRRFDANKLGQVSFKAPELIDSSGWINSAPLHLKDLRGKVIALHFWAFG